MNPKVKTFISPVTDVQPPETANLPADPKPFGVRTLKFVAPQDGPGFSVASALSTELNGRATKHSIEYMPWIRAFRVTYRDDNGKIVGYIPEHRVSCWYPAY